MNDGMELLIVLADGTSSETVRRRYEVTQTASPRVFAVRRTGPDMERELRARPEILSVAAADVAPEILADLSESEALFVQAWSRRMREATTKTRPGEGRSWDASGYQPPDRPPPDRQ